MTVTGYVPFSWHDQMIEFYPQIKQVHIAAVLASGGIFLLRGLLLQVGQQWAMAAPLRYFSYAIDTVLLTAAFMLLTILPSAVYANGWLGVKIGLLAIYIGLGTYALKRGRTPGSRRLFFVGALLVYGCMYAIARMHHPLGPIKMLAGWLA